MPISRVEFGQEWSHDIAHLLYTLKARLYDINEWLSVSLLNYIYEYLKTYIYIYIYIYIYKFEDIHIYTYVKFNVTFIV